MAASRQSLQDGEGLVVVYFVEKLDGSPAVLARLQASVASGLGGLPHSAALGFYFLCFLPLKLPRTPDQVAVDARISPCA